MKSVKQALKSNKGFTMQDLAIAIIAFVLLAGTVTSIYLSIYKVQADTQVDAVATLYTIQIMERIDKLAYDEVVENNLENLVNTMRQDFTIPSSFRIGLEIIPYNQDDIVKTVKLTFTYSFSGKEKNIIIERLKVKEI